jgi:hypothetical protein
MLPRCMQGGGVSLALTRHGEGRGAMRKRLLVLLMTVMLVVMSAAPALAAAGGTDRPGPRYLAHHEGSMTTPMNSVLTMS